MILLADSGSTKTHWCVIDGGLIIKQIFTNGTNPFFQSVEEIAAEIGTNLVSQISGFAIDKIYFYGAGCAFPDKEQMIKTALQRYFTADIEVGSDLLAAARGLCGEKQGIACIMGTGSNSCFYDGDKIIENISPLGFILGDEGSGSYLGKQLVGDCLKNQLPVALKEKFLLQYKLTPALILEQVYKKPFPNRFLASLSPFLLQNIEVPQVHELVLNAFIAFFRRNVMQYTNYRCPISFVGSVAYYYKPVLEEAACTLDLTLGKVIQSPMPGLIDYHS